ncbi:MAG: TonB-dependent receptor plug domain-containing protein, partial [Luteibaculum sp.]
GSSDVGLTLDGPSGENSSFIFSLRRSYLQFLFQALGLPFLPTYNDFQYKHDFDLDAKNRLTLIGLGAIDQFKLNTSVNDGITDPEVLQRNNYILGNLPVNEQWNYTIGAKWTHFGKDNNQVWVLSRSHLNNSASKYQNNTEQPENLVLDYNSEEIENNFRYEYNTQLNQWNINAGLSAALLQYTNKTTNVLEQNGELALLNYESTLDIFEYAPFFQASRKFLSNRLSLSMGFRLNGLAYNEEMAKPFKHLSPRLSASYAITEKLYWNNNLARYYQIPPLTALGYRDNTGSLVNKTQMDFIENDQVVSGLEYRITDYAKISVEGFYKKYRNYPLSLNDSISLANLGADFGVIGTEPLSSTSEGRSYGLELFIQQKLSSSVYGLISYTYVHSEFENGDNNFVPASWDNRHILNLVAGKKLKKNWEFGLKFRLLGGAPYTPVDVPLSTQKQIWNVTRQGIPDWSRINSERLPVAHALDVRIDKIWYFKKWSINAYIDVQNVYNYVVQGPPFLDVERDAQGNPIEDPMNPSRYQSTFIENQSGTVLPSIGLMLEW